MKRFFILASLCITAALCAGSVLYVDDNAPSDPGAGEPLISDPGEDGSQAHPFDAIQQAIDAAANGGEVIILPGTYTGPGNRDIDFKGKPITVRSTNPDDPNIVAATVIDCQGTEAEPHRGFHFHNGESTNSVLTGVTVTGGYSQTGGGILCEHSSPSISNCSIIRNIATDETYFDKGGGGILCLNSNGSIVNCSIEHNVGGGACVTNTSPKIIACHIADNSSRLSGGGIRAWHASVEIENSTITQNRAKAGGGIAFYYGQPRLVKSVVQENLLEGSNGSGGGVFCQGSDLTVQGSIMAGNLSQRNGGGAWFTGCIVAISGCTIAGNRAGTDGGGIYVAASGPFGSGVELRDSILWGNRAARGDQITCEVNDIDFPIFGNAGLWYSDIEDGMDGTFFDGRYGPRVHLMDGTIDTDPLFADPGRWDENGTPDDMSDDKWIDGDYHLKSYAGRWDPASEQWVMDNAQSPCIDAGSPASDYSNEPAYNGGRVNMGAYGNTPFASKTPNCPARPVGDLDDDCKVTFADLALFAAHWLDCNLDPPIACE